jgi:rifampicin phosphotransferase
MMDLTSAGILEPRVSDGRVGRAGGLWLTDTLPSERFPLYTRLNANDVLPDPITPLGATLAWIPHILPGWVAGNVALGAFAPEEFGSEAVAPNAGFFYGRLYVNQTLVRIMGIRSGIGWQAIDSAFFSSDAPPHRERPSDVNPALSTGMAQRTNWVLTATTFPHLDEERRIADDCRTGRPDLASLSAAALVARARSVMPLERLMWRGHTIGSSCAPVGPSVITQLVGADHASLVVWLIGNAGDVDSAAPPFALWDLSRAVRDDEAVSKEFDDGLDGLLDRLRTRQPEFAARFAGFLADYGYRGPSEWDLGSDSWETRPQLPLGLVDRLRQLPDEASPRARAATRETDTAAALEQALDIVGDNPESVQALHTAIASARRFASWRERGKTNCIKVLHEARVALVELGRRLHTEGHLSSPRQVFMALESELDRLVADPASMTPILDQRERQWRELAPLQEPTYVQAGQPLLPLSQLPLRHEAEVEVARPGDVLHGAPASPGVARGSARVIRTLEEIADFQPGEILVAPQTDPSWTPLFLVSSGVVVDVGAMGSHAMIISRELGIPCAAGVTDATRRITTGATVEVDGSTGTVRVLSD